MSILESFYLLFDSNTDKLKKGATEAEKITDELETSLNATTESAAKFREEMGAAIDDVLSGDVFDEAMAWGEGLLRSAEEAAGISEEMDTLSESVDKADEGIEGLEESVDKANEASEDLGDSFSGVAKGAIAALSSVLAVGVLISSVFKSANVSDNLGLMSQGLNITASDLTAWGRAATSFGGSSEALQGSIKGLNQSLFDLYLTGDSAILKPLLRLGINFSDAAGKMKRPLDLLSDIAKSFEGRSKFETTAIGNQLGLDAGTIRLLQEGSDKVDEFVKRQKQLGTVTEEDAEIARKFNQQLADMGTITDTIYRTIASVFLPVITAALEGIEELFLFLKRNKTVAVVFFSLFAAGALAASAAAVAASTVIIPAMLRIAASVLAATWPFVAVVAAITAISAAIALVVDDLVNFADGNKSVLGEVLTYWKDFVKYILDFLDLLANPAGAIGKAIGKMFANATDDLTENSSFEDVMKYFGFTERSNPQNNQKDDIQTGIAVAQRHLDIVDRTTIPPNSFASSNRQSSVSIEKIVVETKATSSEGIAQSIREPLERMLTQAQEQLDNGVVK